MDNALEHPEHGIDLPDARHVGALRASNGLRPARMDLAANSATGPISGAFFAGAGYLILPCANGRSDRFTLAIYGFALIGPIVAVRLYESSRRSAADGRCGFVASVKGLERESDELAYSGIGSAIVFTANMFGLVLLMSLAGHASRYACEDVVDQDQN